MCNLYKVSDTKPVYWIYKALKMDNDRKLILSNLRDQNGQVVVLKHVLMSDTFFASTTL